MSSLTVEKPNSGRDIRFDILKTIGLLCIILAHVIPKNFLFHLRNFDVPLMVIVSGTLFYYSSSHRNSSFWDYLIKRVPRLLAPVWLFLSFFFITAYFLYLVLGQKYPFSFKEIVDSFALLQGIGYVWIIRVFILVSIISTSVLNFYRYCRSEIRFLGWLLAIYVGYELVYYFLNFKFINLLKANDLWKNYIFYIIPYGCLFGFGIILPKIRNKYLIAIAMFFLSVFLSLMIYYYNLKNVIIEPQDFKYPPRIYYFSYGIFMSMMAFISVDKICKKYNLSENNSFIKIIVFISSSSLWIYLWHIFFLFYWDVIDKSFLNINQNFYIIPFLVVTILSVTTTYFQKIIVNNFIRKTQFGQAHAGIISILLLK